MMSATLNPRARAPSGAKNPDQPDRSSLADPAGCIGSRSQTHGDEGRKSALLVPCCLSTHKPAVRKLRTCLVGTVQRNSLLPGIGRERLPVGTRTVQVLKPVALPFCQRIDD